MADLASSAVVLVDNYTSNGPNGKKHRVFKLTATLAAMGTTTNKITAAVLGLEKIEGCSPLIKDDNTLIVVASPSADGTLLLLKAAGTNAPADATGVFTFTVWGI